MHVHVCGCVADLQLGLWQLVDKSVQAWSPAVRQPSLLSQLPVAPSQPVNKRHRWTHSLWCILSIIGKIHTITRAAREPQPACLAPKCHGHVRCQCASLKDKCSLQQSIAAGHVDFQILVTCAHCMCIPFCTSHLVQLFLTEDAALEKLIFCLLLQLLSSQHAAAAVA